MNGRRSDEELDLAVKLGVYELDQQRPGWEDIVHLPTLQMSSECSCVLGQVFSTPLVRWGYYSGVQTLSGAPVNPDAEGYADLDSAWAREHGFDASPDHDVAIDFRALQARWSTVIRERQDAKRKAS